MVRIFLREIRIEHSLFAMPFAFLGAVIGTHGHPTLWQIVWIALAVFGARTAAMAANRLFDKDIDAKNPRTASRATATGQLAPQVMVTAIALGLALTLISAFELNPLCVQLLPLAAAGVLVYPLCKRFTWLTHFVLGAIDGFAPLGAMVAVTGHITWVGILLFLAVTLWVGGFDILYALMDLEIDRTQGIFSFPARFGEQAGRITPLVLHVLMTACLFFAGQLAAAPPLYLLGIAVSLGLVVYEWRVISDHANVFALNERIFNANMIFSVIFLATTTASYWVAV